jgi:hypothetical protein
MHKILEKYDTHRDTLHEGRYMHLIFHPTIFKIMEEEDLIEILHAKSNNIEPLSKALISLTEIHADHFEVALFKYKRKWFEKYKLLIDEKLMWIVERRGEE